MEPGISLEKDPNRRLAMMTSTLQVKGRINVLRSLGIGRSTIIQSVKKSLDSSCGAPLDPLKGHLEVTIKQRLDHYLRAKKAPTGPGSAQSARKRQSEEDEKLINNLRSQLTESQSKTL